MAASNFWSCPKGFPPMTPLIGSCACWIRCSFRACFLNWMQAVAEVTQGEVVAIDGKALRRSFEKGTAKRAIHMVSAWATENGVVLGQRKVDTKSNEITAIPALLDLLALKGCIVTIDAMGCQRAIAQKIVEQGADYVLALKGNQPTLAQAVERFFVTGPEADAHRLRVRYHEQSERGHGRVETRCAWITAELGPGGARQPRGPGSAVSGWCEASRTVAGETSCRTALLSEQPPARRRTICSGRPQALGD